MLNEHVLKWKFILEVFKVYGSEEILHVIEIPEENILSFIVDDKTDLIDMAAFMRKIELPGLSVVAAPCYVEDSDAPRYVIVELQYGDE